MKSDRASAGNGSGSGLKINFACGYHTWDGFYCVDAVQNPRAKRTIDLIHALRFDGTRLINPLPLDDQCADELHSIHFIEHVYQWEAPAVIREFHRLLKPGGLLVLELPNLEMACHNLLKGTKDQFSMWSLYGDPNKIDPYMCHRWGYTPATIQTLVTENGFKSSKMKAPKFHGQREYRDMRIEARA
jgi:predicted SAM-dependent methyltransferase